MPHLHHAEDIQAVSSSTILLPLLLSCSLSNAARRNKNIVNVLLHDITDSVHAQDLPVIHLHMHGVKLFPGKCVHHTHIFPTPFSSFPDDLMPRPASLFHHCFCSPTGYHDFIVNISCYPKREPSLPDGREGSLYLFNRYHNFCCKPTDFRKRSDFKKIFDCFHIYKYSFFHS